MFSIIIKLKRNTLSIIYILFTIFLIFFANTNIHIVKSSLNIWFNNIIPSLFPFFIATELINSTNIPYYFEKIFNRFMRPLFNVPGIGAYAFFLGILSGYPIGAKIVSDFRKNNLCTKEEAERLITFTNNSGPLFILGTVGLTLFNNIFIGIMLLFTHILSSFTVGLIFKFWKSKNFYQPRSSQDNKTSNFSTLGEVLSNSILSATKSVIIIGGFLIIFGIIISILQNCKIFLLLNYIFTPIFNILRIPCTFIIPFFSGLIEITNGITMLSSIICNNITINLVLISFLLGFGGISIMLQVLSIISKTDISIKPYILAKFLQGLISAFYTYIFIYISHFIKY